MKKHIYLSITALLFLPIISAAQFKGLNTGSAVSVERGTSSPSKQWIISLTPDGDFQRALSEESVTPVSGSLGITADKYIKIGSSETPTPNAQFGVFFSVASNNSVVEATFDDNNQVSNRMLFGSTILLPSTVGTLSKATAVNLQFYPFLSKVKDKDNTFDSFWKKLGFGGFYNGSSMDWKAGDQNERVLHNAGGIYIYNRVLETVTNSDESNNQFILTPYVGYTFRNLNGEIRNESDFRNTILGTRDRWFHGIEPGLQIVVNSLRTNIAIPVFLNNDIDGLNFGQLMITFGVSGNLVLAKKSSN